MGGFATVDFSAGVTRDKYRIEFFVKNAFDAKGQLNRYGGACGTPRSWRRQSPGALAWQPLADETKATGAGLG